MRKAAQEFNLDSLCSMSIGRLILTGDLAISITEEYQNRFGENENILEEDYKQISGFLLESTLTKDLNELLELYSKSVKRIGVEKVFFTDKQELFRYSTLSKDSTKIPNKILDCVLWIEFKDK